VFAHNGGHRREKGGRVFDLLINVKQDMGIKMRKKAQVNLGEINILFRGSRVISGSARTDNNTCSRLRRKQGKKRNLMSWVHWV